MRIPGFHVQPLLHIDGIHAFYLNGMVKSLVSSFIGIFTPVYLYRLGMVQWNDYRLAISFVAGYYLLVRLVLFISAIPISRIIESLGFRRSIVVSLLAEVLMVIFILLSTRAIWIAAAAAVAFGLHIGFYWIARNSAISQDGARKHVGKQLGNLMTLENAAVLVGPLAAGLIIEKWGFFWIYAGAAFLLILSVFPLWYMPHHTHKNGVSLYGFRMWLANRRYSHLAVGMAGRSVDDHAIAILWPLAIFTMGIHASVLGAIYSSVAVVSLATRFTLGRLFDSWHSKKDFTDEVIYAFASVITSVVWLVRMFVSSAAGILLLDIGGGVFGTAYGGIYNNYAQLGGMRMGSIAYWVYAEMVYSASAVGLMAAVIAGVWFGVWREAAFVLASVWVLVSLVMARESNLK